MSITLQLISSKFVLRHTHFHNAHKAVRGLVRTLPREIEHVNSATLLETTHVAEATRLFGWILKTDDDFDLADPDMHRDTTDTRPRDALSIEYVGTSLRDDDLLFQALAPFVEAGSFIEVESEGTERWRWFFDGQTCHAQKAQISYSAAPTKPNDPTWIRQTGNVSPDEEHEGFTLRGRAERADQAIKAYNTLREDPEFADSDVSDLLTDLRHLVDREGWDWEEALARAGRNYEAETHKEED